MNPRSPQLDCTTCGACCREGFDAVEVDDDDPFVDLHPDLLREFAGHRHLPRPGGRCVCLDGESGAWSCRVYADRPQSCRDFEIGSDNCLEARRRVGLA